MTARVFFDTQQYSYFVDPDQTVHSDDALERVLRALDDGEIEVIGSLDLLQELLEAFPRQEPRSVAMVELLFDLCGPRLLLPLRDRHLAESRNGGLLGESACYLTRAVRRDVQRVARTKGDVVQLADRIFLEKEEFLEGERKLQEEMRRDLGENGVPLPRLMRSWIESVDMAGWVAEIVQHNPAAALPAGDSGKVGPDRYPSAWAFVCGRLARLVHTLGEGRKLKASDLADAHHVACGPYLDVLVTDDKALRSALDLVADRLPFRCVGSPDFFSTVLPASD